VWGLVALLWCATYAYALSWRNDLNAALEEAKTAEKPLMVDFYTTWCGWCTKLDQDVYTDKKVRELADEFICVKVDAEKDKAAAARYGVTGYPTIIFLNYEGAVDTQIRGYRPAADFASIMVQALDKTKKPTAKKAAPGLKDILSGAVDKVKTSRFKLSGIMYDPQDPRALVNNTVVKVGDYVDGAEVVAITQDNVELSAGGETVMLEMD